MCQLPSTLAIFIAAALLLGVSKSEDAANAKTGLDATGPVLTFDGKPFRIFAGTIHYFRVPRQYWQDRLEKLKAAGLNTVVTEVPWNQHEEVKGRFEFGQENKDLDLVEYVRLAQQLNLYVIIRPGPYICAEWDWGGYPAWLLQDPQMKLRSLYAGYTEAAETYLSHLLPLLAPLQYKNGGPIIAVQLENEYGSFGNDKAYLEWLRAIFIRHGIKELIFTADGPRRLENGTLPDVFAVANFQEDPEESLRNLTRFQPNRPVMVGEFWSGWFDHWSEKHNRLSDANFTAWLEAVLDYQNASVNFYMFHGGSNFGFWNGANRNYTSDSATDGLYQPTITSYDYDAPLDEAGQPSSKYEIIRNLMAKHNPDFSPNSTPQPAQAVLSATNYGAIKVKEFLTLTSLMHSMKFTKVVHPDFMEMICRPPKKESKKKRKQAKLLVIAQNEDVAGGKGKPCITQNYGFIAYRKLIKPKKASNSTTDDALSNNTLLIKGVLNDRTLVIVNNKTIATLNGSLSGYIMPNQAQQYELSLPIECATSKCDVIILVENMGRVNFARNPHKFDNERKGFHGTVFFGGSELKGWRTYALDFEQKFLAKLSMQNQRWKKFKAAKHKHTEQPTLYRSRFVIDSQVPADTFLSTQKWSKGSAFVNNFNLGRYWNIGPQQTLYVPGPKLRQGQNEVLLFELHHRGPEFGFQESSFLGPTEPSSS